MRTWNHGNNSFYFQCTCFRDTMTLVTRRLVLSMSQSLPIVYSNIWVKSFSTHVRSLCGDDCGGGVSFFKFRNVKIISVKDKNFRYLHLFFFNLSFLLCQFFFGWLDLSLVGNRCIRTECEFVWKNFSPVYRLHLSLSKSWILKEVTFSGWKDFTTRTRPYRTLYGLSCWVRLKLWKKKKELDKKSWY